MCNEKCTAIFTVHINYRTDKTRSLADDYELFFENQDSKDLIFVVGSEEISAHKQILLARNDFIAKMINNNRRNNTGRIKISDMEPNIFKYLLKFIYCKKLETADTDDLLKLLIAADKYSEKSLVNVCARRLI